MLYLVLVGGLFVSFFLGYYLREVLDTLKRVVSRLDGLKHAEEAAKPPSSSFAEPMTRAQVAAMLDEEKIKLLNP